jgi:hypothetical protein
MRSYEDAVVAAGMAVFVARTIPQPAIYIHTKYVIIAFDAVVLATALGAAHCDDIATQAVDNCGDTDMATCTAGHSGDMTMSTRIYIVCELSSGQGPEVSPWKIVGRFSHRACLLRPSSEKHRAKLMGRLCRGGNNLALAG